ncbi:MAG: hypothetical protein JWM91_1362 [Rhodospirillales bacterium]|nr:hypothetical protein [Rhodospirillales bacterium]
MKFVIFGLTISSSWGNGHATLWRGLISALTRLGHEVTFFEKNVPYYAENRDLHGLWDRAELVLYPDWESVQYRAVREIRSADVCMVTSYCPDAVVASDLVLGAARGVACFYDMDTPVTLARLEAGEPVAYLPPQGLADFDLVFSYTGGEALRRLATRLGARRVAPLYGHVDPVHYSPAAASEAFQADLSYIGTFAADRQAMLERLFIGPARRRENLRFVLAGSGYPEHFPWADNIYFVRHLPPLDHPSFYSSSRITLNVTRADMAAMGYCPSGRLFEAAACGTPVLSDSWEGLNSFFEPGVEILVARTTEEALAALDLPPQEIVAIARAARQRVLDEHTSEHRARTLITLIRDNMALSVPAQRASANVAAGG